MFWLSSWLPFDFPSLRTRINIGFLKADDGNWTRDPFLTKEVLYLWATSADQFFADLCNILYREKNVKPFFDFLQFFCVSSAMTVWRQKKTACRLFSVSIQSWAERPVISKTKSCKAANSAQQNVLRMYRGWTITILLRFCLSGVTDCICVAGAYQNPARYNGQKPEGEKTDGRIAAWK